MTIFNGFYGYVLRCWIHFYSRQKTRETVATTQISRDCGSPQALSHVTDVYYDAVRIVTLWQIKTDTGQLKASQAAFRGKYERITRLSPYFHSVQAVDPASERRLCQAERAERMGERVNEGVGGSYIGAFEVSRLLGIKSARPFTGSSGCVAALEFSTKRETPDEKSEKRVSLEVVTTICHVVASIPWQIGSDVFSNSDQWSIKSSRIKPQTRDIIVKSGTEASSSHLWEFQSSQNQGECASYEVARSVTIIFNNSPFTSLIMPSSCKANKVLLSVAVNLGEDPYKQQVPSLQQFRGQIRNYNDESSNAGSHRVGSGDNGTMHHSLDAPDSMELACESIDPGERSQVGRFTA
ncbi:hypothetical protein WN48_00164 [Eufriesea mexicana]|nr:hypothetical protein WN48_00164 [Eufriesea mexicana]